MKVKLKLYGDLKAKANKSEIELSMPKGSKVRDLLFIISKNFNEEFKEALLNSSGKLKPTIIMLVNGRNIDFINKLETQLADGDIISLVPAVFGG
ncbi:MoaD/ThiS family protein [Candidatus Bathyarchaeota archaeon]|nr:MoaD/ThiS family protein [Candidatus Bathyarchaeota archaeon]